MPSFKKYEINIPLEYLPQLFTFNEVHFEYHTLLPSSPHNVVIFMQLLRTIKIPTFDERWLK
jgi:hypothetical protein